MRIQKSVANIVNKKFPVSFAPFVSGQVLRPSFEMKANACCRDQIEFSVEIRERDLCLNTGNHARHIQDSECLSIERLDVRVQPHPVVAKQSANVNEKT